MQSEVYLDRLAVVDRKTLFRFLQDLQSRNLSGETLLNYAKEITRFQRWSGKPLTRTSADDLKEYIRHSLNEGRTSYSVRTSTVILKQFFGKWMGKREIKELKLPKANRPLPKPLDENEIFSIVKAGETPYEKAVTAVLYEGGLRVGELRNIKVGDVACDQYGAKIIVKGKTGERPIRLIISAPYLQAFLEHHPFKENLEAHLFYGRSSSNGQHKPTPEHPITNTGVTLLLKRLAAEAGVNGKRIYPHLFRHSRATILSKDMTDRELMTIFGWKSPAMVGVYSHLSMKDVEEKLLRLGGLKPETEKVKSPLTPKSCPRCKHVNSATARFCSQCSMILDLETAVELEQARAKADRIMTQLLEDPKIQRIIAARIGKMNLS